MRDRAAENTIPLRLIPLLLVLCLVLTSCSLDGEETGSLLLSFAPASRALTFLPDLNMQISRIDLTLTKSDSSVQIQKTSTYPLSEPLLFEALSAGVWNLEASGKNASGQTIAEVDGQSIALSVSRGRSTTAQPVLVPLSGEGTLLLTLSFTGSLEELKDPKVVVHFYDRNDQEVVLDNPVFKVTSTTLSNLPFILPAGWYRGMVELYDGDTTLLANLRDRQLFFPRLAKEAITRSSLTFAMKEYQVGDIGPSGGLVFHAYSATEETDAVGSNDATIHGAVRSTIAQSSGLKFYGSGSYMELGQTMNIVPNVLEASIYVRSDHPDDDRVGIVVGNYEGGGVTTSTTGWEVYTNGNPRIWWDGGTQNYIYPYDVRQDRWLTLRWERDLVDNTIYLYVDEGDGVPKRFSPQLLGSSSSGAGRNVNLNEVPRTLRIGSDYPNTRQAFDGYIAHVKIYDATKTLVAYYPMQRYLEAAPNDLVLLQGGVPSCDSQASGYDQSLSIFPFGYLREVSVADSLAAGTYRNLGSGELNTERIVAIDAYALPIGGEPLPGTAAQLCADLIHQGADDWYLPSSEELKLLDKVLHASYNPLSTFLNNAWYWSSSESLQYPDTHAFAHQFKLTFLDTVSHYEKGEQSLFRVRAVRSF